MVEGLNRRGSNQKAFLSCILPHHPSSIKSSIGWVSFKFSFMIKVQVLSHISKLFFQYPTGASQYKVHHDITLNTLTSSHLLLSPFFLARCKELHKHQQESFSPYGTVLLNLSFFPQHPTIPAIAGSDSCLPRDMVVVLWNFHPSYPLTRFLKSFLLTTQKVNILSCHFDSDKLTLILNMKIRIRQNI